MPLSYLKMQIGRIPSSRRTDLRDRLGLLDVLSYLHQYLRIMRIDRLYAVAMVYYDRLPEPLYLLLAEYYPPAP